MNKLYVVGIGPGNADFITPKAMKTIKDSDILIGGQRNLNEINIFGKKQFVLKNNLLEAMNFIDENIKENKISLLATGDPFIYGIGSYISENMTHIEMESISGISSVQYMASKINMRLDDIYITSVHGRNQNIFNAVKNHEKIAIFTGRNPQLVLEYIKNRGFENCTAYVGEMLSYDDEKISIGTVSKLSEKSFGELSLIIIKNEGKSFNGVLCGIDDNVFERGKIPMTKEEIRVLSLSKLRLKCDDILCDIGGGTGSISVEAALLLRKGFVYIYEKNAEAINLIKKNFKKFSIKNADIIEGDIFYTLSDNSFTKVFIGGSGGHMGFIIEFFSKKSVKIVINSITIETTYEALKALKNYGYRNIECINVSISKSFEVGEKHIMKSLNSINIISACGGEYYEG